MTGKRKLNMSLKETAKGGEREREKETGRGRGRLRLTLPLQATLTSHLIAPCGMWHIKLNL